MLNVHAPPPIPASVPHSLSSPHIFLLQHAGYLKDLGGPGNLGGDWAIWQGTYDCGTVATVPAPAPSPNPIIEVDTYEALKSALDCKSGTLFVSSQSLQAGCILEYLAAVYARSSLGVGMVSGVLSTH